MHHDSIFDTTFKAIITSMHHDSIFDTTFNIFLFLYFDGFVFLFVFLVNNGNHFDITVITVAFNFDGVHIWIFSFFDEIWEFLFQIVQHQTGFLSSSKIPMSIQTSLDKLVSTVDIVSTIDMVSTINMVSTV